MVSGVLWRLLRARIPIFRLPPSPSHAADAQLSLEGGLAIAVPLELRGLHLAHSRHGRLPWARLLGPAIEAAQEGFPAHPYLVAALGGDNQTVRPGWAGLAEGSIFFPFYFCIYFWFWRAVAW
jgi:gamma-glutamyltranspeptidase